MKNNNLLTTGGVIPMFGLSHLDAPFYLHNLAKPSRLHGSKFGDHTGIQFLTYLHEMEFETQLGYSGNYHYIGQPIWRLYFPYESHFEQLNFLLNNLPFSNNWISYLLLSYDGLVLYIEMMNAIALASLTSQGISHTNNFSKEWSIPPFRVTLGFS